VDHDGIYFAFSQSTLCHKESPVLSVKRHAAGIPAGAAGELKFAGPLYRVGQYGPGVLLPQGRFANLVKYTPCIIAVN